LSIATNFLLQTGHQLICAIFTSISGFLEIMIFELGQVQDRERGTIHNGAF